MFSFLVVAVVAGIDDPGRAFGSGINDAGYSDAIVAGIGDPGRAFGSGINDAGYSMLPSPLGATPTVKIYAPLGEYFPKNQGLAPIYKTRRTDYQWCAPKRALSHCFPPSG